MQKISSIEEYNSQYKRSVEHPEEFWAGVANDFSWKKKWDSVLKWDFKNYDVKWFLNSKLNITENCIDRHLPNKANDIAFVWESNFDENSNRIITYQQLHDEVCKLANALKSFGVVKGDRVCIYMPMIPESVFAMLACARIGAVHSVVFAGFSAASLSARILDSDCQIVITANESARGNKIIPLKKNVDDALKNCLNVRHVI